MFQNVRWPSLSQTMRKTLPVTRIAQPDVLADDQLGQRGVIECVTPCS